MQPIEAAVAEDGPSAAGLRQVVGERLPRVDVLAPHDRVTDKQDFVRGGGLARETAVLPIVLAQAGGRAVMNSEIGRLPSVRESWYQPPHSQRHREHGQHAAETDSRRRHHEPFRRARRRPLYRAQNWK